MNQKHRPFYRRCSAEVEKAVEFAHQFLSQNPLFSGQYEGGRIGRARIRGAILSVVPDRADEPDCFNWKVYYQIWVCETCKEIGPDYLLEFLDLQGSPKQFHN